MSVAITPHPAWQQTIPGDPGAVWISNYASGYNNTQFQYRSDSSAIFRISETFEVTANTVVSIQVWADDTVRVTLDNGEIWPPWLSSNYTCAGGTVGCIPIYGGVYKGPISQGEHTLTFEPWQQGTGQDTGSNPFGIIFSASVPDGGMTLVLLGAALMGLESLRRKLHA